MKISTSLKSLYREAIPLALRKKLWDLRDMPWRLAAGSKRLANESQKKANDFRRDLVVHLSGRCNACRSKNITRYRNPATAHFGYAFYVCRDCGFIFVAPTPDVSAHYAGQTMPDFGTGEEVWNRHYLDSINKCSEGKGNLLEVGFGNASFLKLAHENGWTVHGAELSLNLVRQAREVCELPNIQFGSLEEIAYPNDFFDVVAGFNFLEHVPDPREILIQIRRILRPSGIVALMCPNISGIYHLLVQEILAANDPLKISWCPPDHLSYFSKNNLTILLRDVGFEVVADESHLMSSLWRQHEVNIGPQVTSEKLKRLLSEIRTSASAKGDMKVAAHREEITMLLAQRMAWTMIEDLIELEPALGAECAIFFLAKKVG